MEHVLAMAKKRRHGNVVQRCRREPTQSPPLVVGVAFEFIRSVGCDDAGHVILARLEKEGR
jgi:hypothetical protein